MKEKYDVTHGNHIARSRVKPAADAEVAQDPVKGLNRVVVVEEGESSSRVLDRSKTGCKILRNRMGDSWVVRKISALFKRLLIRFGKTLNLPAGRLLDR